MRALAADPKAQDDPSGAIVYSQYVIAGSNYLFEIGDEQGDYTATVCGVLSYLHGNGFDQATNYYHGTAFAGC